MLSQIVGELGRQTGIDLHLVPVVNQFFGPVTTVSGLLTGKDVLAALQGQRLGDLVLLPSAMFASRYGAGSTPPGTTLDDMHISDIASRLPPWTGLHSGVQVKAAATISEVLAALT